jgi:membrane fusion protein (multidrug efflux system)
MKRFALTSFRKKNRFLIGLLSPFLLFPLFLSCEKSEDVSSANGRKAKQVQVSPVTEATFLETVEGIGTLEAKETVEIRPEIPGTVRGIHFREGRQVTRGDLLFTLDDQKVLRRLAERKNALQAAKSQLENAAKDFKRFTALLESEVISKDEWDQVRTNLETAQAERKRIQAEVALIRENLEDTRIEAPLSGMLSESRVDVGDYVDVGDVLATLYQISPIQVTFKVPDRYVGRVKEGQECRVEVTAHPGRTFKGRVSFVSPSVDPETRDFSVKATLENTDRMLKPGAYAAASTILETLDQCPAIPEEALVSTRKGHMVFVVKNGKAEGRTVSLGHRKPGVVEICKGVTFGDQVVTKGHMGLSDGDPVHIENTPPRSTATLPDKTGGEAAR